MDRRPLTSDLEDTQEIPASALAELRAMVRAQCRRDVARAVRLRYYLGLRRFRRWAMALISGEVAE